MSAHPNSYNGNMQVKADGVQQNFTSFEIQEYQKCMADPVYFTKTYVKIIHVDHGLVPFRLYPYQEKMFNHFNDNRFSIVLAPRQVGKSASAIIYLLWYALFHSEKTIAILANKGAIARDMLARITLALENVPFFLQPGTKVLNKGSIVFSNNSEILAAATSSSSIRGKSVAFKAPAITKRFGLTGKMFQDETKNGKGKPLPTHRSCNLTRSLTVLSWAAAAH